MYILACGVNTFAYSRSQGPKVPVVRCKQWRLMNICKGIYGTTRPLYFINCRINQGRTGNLEEGFSNGLFLLQQYFNTDS